MILRRKCCHCSKEAFMKVKAEDFERWRLGARIQTAMPYLSVNERELLISGICGGCFDKMLGGGEG